MTYDEIREALRRHVDSSGRSWSSERWFAGKDRTVDHVELVDAFVLREVEPVGVFALVDVFFFEGDPQRYHLPYVVDSSAEIREVESSSGLWLETVAALREERVLEGEHGVLRFRRSAEEFPLPERCATARRLSVDQSNTSVVLDEALLLKIYRRIELGVNPDVEVSEFLSSRVGFERSPRVAGWFEHESSKGIASLGLFCEFLPQATDGWVHALTLAGDTNRRQEWLDYARSLGELTADLHRALASRSEPPFAPETVTEEHVGVLRERAEAALECASRPSMDLPAFVLDRLPYLLKRESDGRGAGTGGRRIRVHGDFHLGQIVLSDGRLYVVDFEGEPLRSMDERRAKDSPLRDVAGMLRSFHYAISVAGQSDAATELANLNATREHFLHAYHRGIEGATPALVPGEPTSTQLLELLELEKALYEYVYETRYRPGMREVPRSFLSRYFDQEPAS